MSLSPSTAVDVIVIGGRKASPTISLMSPLSPKIKGLTPTLAISFMGDSWTKQATIRVSVVSERRMWSTALLPQCHVAVNFISTGKIYCLLTISGPARNLVAHPL